MSVKLFLVVPIATVLSLFPTTIKHDDINQIGKLNYISSKVIEKSVEKIDKDYQECVDLLFNND